MTMKKEGIQTRKRKPKSQGNPSSKSKHNHNHQDHQKYSQPAHSNGNGSPNGQIQMQLSADSRLPGFSHLSSLSMSAPDSLTIPVHHDSINDAYTSNITTLAPLNPLGISADHWQSSYPVGGGLGANINPFPTPTEPPSQPGLPFYHHQQLQQMQMQPMHSNGHDSPHHLIPALQQVVTTLSSSSSILSNGAGVHVDENGDITVNPINPNEGAESETREGQPTTECSPRTGSEQNIVEAKPSTTVIISAPTPPPQTSVVSA
jgi:hypothetical protein